MELKKSERKAITKETLRELYAKSGNQCAFPGCSHLMINKEGKFIGQICHIEAAEPKGQRYNKNLPPEKRSAFPNLMLMCYPHHVETNDVVKYTVEVLRTLKAAHEAKFMDVAQAIQDAITDHSLTTELRHPKTLKRLMGSDHRLTDNQLRETVKEVEWAADRVRMLPTQTRQLLCVIIGRLRRKQLAKANYRYDESIYLREVCEACHLSASRVRSHIRTMEKYGVAREDDNDPSGNRIILYGTPNSGWFIWGDLQEVCTREGLSLSEILENLRFDLLD